MMHFLLQAQQPGGYGVFVYLGLFVLVMYFFMYRPQQKRRKEQAKFREEMGTGMRVVTFGGIHGEIIKKESDSVILSLESGSKMRIDTSSISHKEGEKPPMPTR